MQVSSLNIVVKSAMLKMSQNLPTTFTVMNSTFQTCYLSTAFAGFGSTPSAGFPLDVSLSLGLNGVQKLRNDEIQTCQDGKSFFYRGVLQNSQPNLSKPSFTSSAITIHSGCLV